MIVLYIISALCLLGYILIIKVVFTKHPPLTPKEEKKLQAQLEADHMRTVQKLKDTKEDLTFGATMVGLGLLKEAMKADEKMKRRGKEW